MDISSLNESVRRTDFQPVSEISQDFETFLKMLTTQIQNQDPLNPMAADQFSSQLASFSMVEQQTLTNQNLQSLLERMSATGVAEYSAVVGRFALHDGPFAYFGTPVRFEILDVSAQEQGWMIAIRNESGDVVAERNLGAGQVSLTWDGLNMQGDTVAFGTYVAELRNLNDGAVRDIPVYTGAVVEEVRLVGSEARLLLADGSLIPEKDVAALR